MKENPKLKEVIIKKDNFVNDDKLARELIEAQEKWELDYKAGISCAKKEGLAEGHATGLAEGHAAGLAEGKLEKEKLIKNLLKMNMDIETISKATGLKVSRTRDYLKMLVDKGLIDVEGNYKNKLYKLKTPPKI